MTDIQISSAFDSGNIEVLSISGSRAALTIRKATYWGFPIVLVYDTLFLLPMNKRRARRKVDEDAALRSVAKVGRARGLVRLVQAVFALDNLFRWMPFGPGLLLVAKKPR